jgi:hypothetical protein
MERGNPLPTNRKEGKENVSVLCLRYRRNGHGYGNHRHENQQIKKIKKFQKPIDKRAILWYNIDAEEKRGSQVPTIQRKKEVNNNDN